MLADKTRWLGLRGMGGLAFSLWGVCNLGVYGLSHVMHKENFDYHFAYTGNGKLMQPFKSMMAAESLSNAA